jgi:CheY-like chemotaxis protein
MIDDLLSLRALVVSPEEGVRDLFWRASSFVSMPFEIVAAADAAEAVDACGRSTRAPDIAYLDGALGPEELKRVILALRAASKPAFTIQLAPGAAAQSFETDALAGRPTRPEQAQWLLERSTKVWLSSRVLVVDDSPTMRSIVRKTLAATRFPLDVSEADEGFLALRLVREKDFDIVFLDYNMPEFNGLETLSEFKREERRVTVVMMTSSPSEELAERARGLGAAFLKKPFFPADIEAVLSGFYGLRALNPKRL